MTQHQTYMVSKLLELWLLEGWCGGGVQMRVIVDVTWIVVDHKEV